MVAQTDSGRPAGGVGALFIRTRQAAYGSSGSAPMAVRPIGSGGFTIYHRSGDASADGDLSGRAWRPVRQALRLSLIALSGTLRSLPFAADEDRLRCNDGAPLLPPE